MPCYITGSSEGDARLSEAEAHAEATKLARLLCALCLEADKHGLTLPDDVLVWWAKHKAIDRTREKYRSIAAGQIRKFKHAIAKLQKQRKEEPLKTIMLRSLKEQLSDLEEELKHL